MLLSDLRCSRAAVSFSRAARNWPRVCSFFSVARRIVKPSAREGCYTHKHSTNSRDDLVLLHHRARHQPHFAFDAALPQIRIRLVDNLNTVVFLAMRMCHIVAA